jgi:hypothetical protein
MRERQRGREGRLKYKCRFDFRQYNLSVRILTFSIPCWLFNISDYVTNSNTMHNCFILKFHLQSPTCFEEQLIIIIRDAFPGRKGKHYGMLPYISSRITPLMPLQKYLSMLLRSQMRVRFKEPLKALVKTLTPSALHYHLFHLRYTQIWSRWRSWLRHCATSRKVAGSIPDGVIGIILWHNPSGRTMALGSTQPLTEMSTRNISWGVKAADV